MLKDSHSRAHTRGFIRREIDLKLRKTRDSKKLNASKVIAFQYARMKLLGHLIILLFRKIEKRFFFATKVPKIANGNEKA